MAQKDMGINRNTAITTPFDLFEFLGMPPGLRCATQTFQRHVGNVWKGTSSPPQSNFYLCTRQQTHNQFQRLPVFGIKEVINFSYTINQDNENYYLNM